MVSYHIYYGLGIIVSIVSVLLWTIVIRSQLKQFKSKNTNIYIKKVLLIFGAVSIMSNFVPVWFDVYQILRNAHPSNIGIAYNTSQYIFRVTTAIMFFLIYRLK